MADPVTQEPEQGPPPSKLLLELGPLILFFVTNWLRGIYWATGVLMVAMTISIAITWRREHKIPPMLVFTGVAVLLFGTLTFVFEDETFIKVKVTILNVLLGGILLFGLATGRPFLQLLFGQAFQLTERGWRLLTIRYAVFLFSLAVLNEAIWRNVSTDTWVTFKAFGIIALTLVFTIAQVPLLQRHAPAEEADAGEEPARPAE
jgi:intracellular septation protein